METTKKNQEKDSILNTLNDIVSNNEAEIGITLTVNGSLITGTLIGMDRYLDMLSAGFEKTPNEESLSNVLKAYFEEASQFHKELLLDEEKEQEDEPTEYVYIHLKNAQYIFGGSMVPTGQGTLWRGKVESVDGFSIGSLVRG